MIIIWEGLSSPLWNKKWLQDLTRLIAEKASAMLDIQAIFNMCFQMICSADQYTVLFLYLTKLCLFSKGNIEFHMVFHPCFSRSFTHSIGFSLCFSYIPFTYFSHGISHAILWNTKWKCGARFTGFSDTWLYSHGISHFCEKVCDIAVKRGFFTWFSRELHTISTRFPTHCRDSELRSGSNLRTESRKSAIFEVG